MGWSTAKVARNFFLIYIVTSTTLLMSVTCLNGQRCDVAQQECAFRQGCGMALTSYMTDCARLITGESNECSVPCQRALIALMSTDEGELLIDCDCNGSELCEMNKKRIQVCGPEVFEATAVGSVVSCSTARSICLADQLCSTALDYYHYFCQGMFKGRRCTPKCKNSLDILNRQEKAAKLKTCYCEGDEDFACKRIKESTEKLCFAPDFNEANNDIDLIAASTSHGHESRSRHLFLLVTAILLLFWFPAQRLSSL